MLRRSRQLSPSEIAQKVIDNCIPEPNSGCWLWLGPADTAGYGLVNIGLVYASAHRTSYFYLKVPRSEDFDYFFRKCFDKTLVIRHLCHNTYCVNPEHLEKGTARDNGQDTARKNRMLTKMQWRYR
jgi:hypothetical protein